MEIKNVGMILKTMAIVLLILGVIGSFFIFAALDDILYRNGLLRFFTVIQHFNFRNHMVTYVWLWAVD